MKEFTHLEQQKQQKQTQKRHAGTISIFVLFYDKFFYNVRKTQMELILH